MAATSEEYAPVIPNPKPLFSSDPIDYIKLTSEEGPDQHIFIVDKDAAVRYSSTIKDLINISQEMEKGGLQDDQAASSSSAVADLHPIEFREIPMRALETCVKFFYWKKRWANVVTERIPDFPLPSEEPCP